MDALFQKVREEYEVSSIFIPKSNRLVFELIAKPGNIEDLRDRKQELKGDVVIWALDKKESNQLIFNYAFLTYGDNGKADGIKLTRTACFIAGTKVWLSDYSPIHIENIEKGMRVITFDSNTGREVSGLVSHTMTHQANVLVKVYTSSDTLLTTVEHPFKVGKYWISAGQLKKGDLLTTLSHQGFKTTSATSLAFSDIGVIKDIVYVDTLVTVYNFTVEKYHSYYVGNIGILVHNNCSDEALDEAKRILGNSVLSNIREVSKEEFLNESDNSYEYFYRAMSTEEFYGNGMGLIIGRYDEIVDEWVGEPNFTTNDLNYLIKPQCGLLTREYLKDKYQYVVRYKVTKGIGDSLDANSVLHGTSKSKIKALIKNKKVSKKREGKQCLEYQHYSYGFHGDVANWHFHPNIGEITYIKTSKLL